MMEKLTRAEEPIMKALWSLKKGFVKDIIELLPEPKPPYNTVSSVIRILVKKGFVSFNAYGKTYEYFPAITQSAYKRFELKSLVANYFKGSPKDLVSFMVEKEELSADDVSEIRKLLATKKPSP